MSSSSSGDSMNKETDGNEVTGEKELVFIDAEYEKGLYTELLEIARMLHSGTKGRNVVIREIPSKNPIMVRRAIRENLDFIRLTSKYMLLDIEATRRERNDLTEDK
jgi:hypothetical protein